mmetsp:Transcript_29874/g.43855  ORF Transcript_29874/g.43855 Transcript_29874/m.43855 type:complete len:536 (-) Transcript_29874:134-1741(-)
MPNLFLLIVLGVTLLLLIIVGVYVIVHFGHPDDKNDAYLPKIVVLFGFVLAFGTVLLLPLDVANGEGFVGCIGWDDIGCGGLDMALFWEIVFWTITVTLFFVIPFTSFYYETDDFLLSSVTSDKIEKIGCGTKLKNALCWEFMVAVVIGCILFLSFTFSNQTKIPVTLMTGSSVSEAATFTFPAGSTFAIDDFEDVQTSEITNAALASVNESEENIEIELTFTQFLPAILVFLGYFFFSIFAGIGLVAIPMDLIRSYIDRPVHMDAVEYANAQIQIRQRVNALVAEGEELAKAKDEDLSSLGFWERRKKSNETSAQLKQFKKNVYLLEEDYDVLKLAKNYHSRFGVLFYPLKLALGVISGLISFLWIIQTAIYTLPDDPIHPFLNTYLDLLSFFPLFPVVTVLILSVYLLVCVIVGNFKFGLRIGWFTIHPMKINGTYMSSFLFNIGLILLCAVPAVQFVVMGLTIYARYSTVFQIFGTTVFYLDFFSFFFENHVFIIALLASSGLTILYWICCKSGAGEGGKLADKIKGIASGS